MPRLGLAPGLGDWGTPQPTHPSPPPFLQHKRLQAEPPSPCNLPVAQGSATSAVPGPRSRSKGGRGAGLRRRDPGRGRQASQPGTLSSPTAFGASYRPA